MTEASALHFALTLREATIREYAQERFPGIERLEERSISTGRDEGTETLALVGSWHGVWLKFTEAGTAIYTHVVAQCRCCHRYSTTTTQTPNLPNAAALATFYTEVPAANVDQCPSCTWLHATQLEALKVSSWLSRVRFEARRRTTADTVLARHRPRG